MAKKKGTLPATTDGGPLEHDDETRIMAERVMVIQQETKWDLPTARGKPLVGEALDGWLDKKDDQAAVNMVERGIGYLLKKRELGHGAFQGWIKDTGRSTRGVQEAMQVARLLMGLSEQNTRRAALLPQRKLTALASAPAPLIDDLFSAGVLDDAAEMTREQLREIIQLRKRVEKQQQREDRLTQVIADQDEELRKRSALPEVHAHVLELRQAAIDETQALRANAHQLQVIMDGINVLPRDFDTAQLDSIAHPLMYALHGLHATVGALLEQGFNTFANFYPDIDVFPPQLDEAEVARALRVAAEFGQAAETRAIHRENDLAAKSKRGRGRPRKKATK